MKLAIQKFLREQHPNTAIKKAVEKFGIDVSEQDDLVQLNYGIDSPRVQETNECRGLILKKFTWDIVAYPFYRFFNHTEGHAAKCNLDSSVLFQKLDGSLLIVYPHNGTINVATRGMMFAHGTVGAAYMKTTSAKTFADLFWETIGMVCPKLSNKYMWPNDICFCMELTTPENRVVTPYFDKKVHVLSARRTTDWEELSQAELLNVCEYMGLPMPKVYEFKNDKHINSLMSMLPTLDEGFVLVDYNQKSNGSFARIKIKNPRYLAAAHLLGSHFSPKRVLECILADGEEEFLSYFPEYKDTFVKVNVALEVLSHELQNEYNAIQHLCLDPKDRAQKKVFAAEAVKTRCSSVLFNLISGSISSVRQGLFDMGRNNLDKLYEILLRTTLKD